MSVGSLIKTNVFFSHGTLLLAHLRTDLSSEFLYEKKSVISLDSFPCKWADSADIPVRKNVS